MFDYLRLVLAHVGMIVHNELWTLRSWVHTMEIVSVLCVDYFFLHKIIMLYYPY